MAFFLFPSKGFSLVSRECTIPSGIQRRVLRLANLVVPLHSNQQWRTEPCTFRLLGSWARGTSPRQYKFNCILWHNLFHYYASFSFALARALPARFKRIDHDPRNIWEWPIGANRSAVTPVANLVWIWVKCATFRNWPSGWPAGGEFRASD